MFIYLKVITAKIMKTQLTLLLLIITTALSAQEKPLTNEEARAYIESTEHADMTVYYEGEELYDMYAKREAGELIISGNEIYKVYGVENAKVQNCNIVAVTNEGFAPEQQKALQKKILAEYKAGKPFQKLIEEYAADGKSGAINYDVVNQGTGFDEAFATHKPGEVFTLEYEGGFYVIVMNGLPVPKKAVRVLHATYKK